MSANDTNPATGPAMGKGPVTNCMQCDSWTAGPGPALCANCRAEGHTLCRNCQQHVTNGTTPYCDQCAEEIIGTG